MSPATRRRTPSADVGDRLVAAADRLLDERGPDALTVRGVADLAQVSPTGVYNHLGGKEGILSALFVIGFDELRAAVDSIDVADPHDALLETGRRYRAMALRHPCRYALMFDRSNNGWVPTDADRAQAALAFQALERRVAAGQAVGRFRQGQPSEIAQVVWSAVHGHVSLELRGMPFAADPDRSYETLLQMVVAGISE
ncbi:MAG: TetR/AcrR family transcriptional regulator [Actinomycetota bacterium]